MDSAKQPAWDKPATGLVPYASLGLEYLAGTIDENAPLADSDTRSHFLHFTQGVA